MLVRCLVLQFVLEPTARGVKKHEILLVRDIEQEALAHWSSVFLPTRIAIDPFSVCGASVTMLQFA